VVVTVADLRALEVSGHVPGDDAVRVVVDRIRRSTGMELHLVVISALVR
jgi:hypothetical protein